MRQSSSGFTLVELLIVVAIIGILSAIAIPQFTKYKRNAAVAQAESDLRNCITEATAQEVVNGSITLNCDTIPGSRLACTIDILPLNGNITLTNPCSNIYEGLTILCNVTNNVGSCQF